MDSEKRLYHQSKHWMKITSGSRIMYLGKVTVYVVDSFMNKAPAFQRVGAFLFYNGYMKYSDFYSSKKIEKIVKKQAISWLEINICLRYNPSTKEAIFMRTAIARIDLGQTRLGVGWVLYDHSTKAFDEMTPREVKLLIKENLVNGLKLVDDKIVVDEEYFSNFVLKTGVGNYRFIKASQRKDTTVMAVTEVSKSKFGRMYEVITNYYQRFVVSEDKLRHYVKTMIVGGAKLVDGELEIATGVHRVLVNDDGTFVSMDDCKGDFDLDLESISLEEIDEKITQLDELFKGQPVAVMEQSDSSDKASSIDVEEEPTEEDNILDEMISVGGLDVSDITDSGVASAGDTCQDAGYIVDGSNSDDDNAGQNVKVTEQHNSKKKNKHKKA